MIERPVDARKEHMVDRHAILAHVKKPASRLQFATSHQLMRDILRMLNSALTINEPETGFVFDRTFAVMKFKDVLRHSGPRLRADYSAPAVSPFKGLQHFVAQLRGIALASLCYSNDLLSDKLHGFVGSVLQAEAP